MNGDELPHNGPGPSAQNSSSARKKWTVSILTKTTTPGAYMGLCKVIYSANKASLSYFSTKH